ncbi:MAG: VWA domain-containing protein [Blastocatellia bacterium]|nr:VWA domain-containing protein [Blastocatellia bacterium]
MNDEELLTRWRLVLGKFAEQQLSCNLSARNQRIEKALDFLYSREYRGRGVRGEDDQTGRSKEKTPGSLDPSQLSVPAWLSEVRDLFPNDTCEIIEKHALDRYGMTELVTDPDVLAKMNPNLELLKTVLTFKGSMQGEVLQVARRIVRQVVEEIKRRLESDVRRTLLGKINRFQHSPLKVAQNLDWRDTIRKNLKHYDPERKKLIVQNVRFFSRVERRLPWDIILCVDQSGSMASSVIHSAVMAGILAGLPALNISLVVFDTNVVDLSGFVDDPVEALMSVQLGGGTDIAQALGYCSRLVKTPHRTVLALVSDFAEGGSVAHMLAIAKAIRESGVTAIGLASLDEGANAFYDVQTGERLADLGWHIAAMTPRHFAHWLAGIIRK